MGTLISSLAGRWGWQYSVSPLFPSFPTLLPKFGNGMIRFPWRLTAIRQKSWIETVICKNPTKRKLTLKVRLQLHWRPSIKTSKERTYQPNQVTVSAGVTASRDRERRGWMVSLCLWHPGLRQAGPLQARLSQACDPASRIRDRSSLLCFNT